MLSTPRHETITLSGVTGTVPPNGPHNYPQGTPQDPTGGWQQPAAYLNPIAPPVPPHLQRRAWPPWVAPLLGIVAVGLLGVFAFIGAALKDEPEPAAGIGTPAPYDALPGQQAATSAQTSASTVGKPGDSNGRRACEAIRTALNSGTTDPATLAGAATVGIYSSNTSIRLASTLLADRARLAVAARGASDEQDLRADVVESARALEQACTTNGYYQP